MPWGIRVLLVGLLVVAAGGIVVLSHQSLQSSANLDQGVVVVLTPTDGSNILQQDAVGITLERGYTTTLQVNGQTLPTDEVREVTFGTQVEFTFEPGPGKAFTAWPAGQNCAAATFWKQSAGPGHTEAEHWCFTVV
jgi:hypothetical protein